MDEESIEEAINKEAVELESILNVKFKRGKELEEEREERCLSVIKLEPNHFPCIPMEHGITKEEDEDEGEEKFWSDEEFEEKKKNSKKKSSAKIISLPED